MAISGVTSGQYFLGLVYFECFYNELLFQVLFFLFITYKTIYIATSGLNSPNTAFAEGLKFKIIFFSVPSKSSALDEQSGKKST